MADTAESLIAEHYATFSESGVTGLSRFGGNVYEEFLPALQGSKAIKVYTEMSLNDPTIGAILLASEQLIRKATWSVEAGGKSNIDVKAADFLKSCLNDMSMTWGNIIAEVLSMLVYGWSYHEIVYKIRRGSQANPRLSSQYNDGLIGWRKIAGRAQVTMHEWMFDDDGGIRGMVQIAPPRYETVIIPIEKALLFRTKADKNNPEGKSVLRNAYRPWYFKKHIEQLEGVGIERDLAGLPVLQPPEGVDIWNPNDPLAVSVKRKGEALVSNIKRDKHEGVLLPFGWTLSLLSTQARRQFDTNAILNRYDQRIAITVLADMVLLGADKVGSFALAREKKNLFTGALEAWCDSIADVFNRYAIPRLFELNAPFFQGLKTLPKLVHGEVDTPSLDELSRYITALSGAQAPLFPDEGLEEHLRAVASLPKPAGTAVPPQPAAKPDAKLKGEEEPTDGDE